MNKPRNTADTPMDRLVSSICNEIREQARAIEPYHHMRHRFVALRVAIELCPGPGREILRNMLAYEMASQTDADELDDLADAMRHSAEVWAAEAEQGAAYLRDPLNRFEE